MTTLAIDWRKKALTVAILVAGATIAGPFGTYEELSAGRRLLYWGVAILGCGVIMEALLITALTHPILRLRPIVRLSAAVVLGSFPAAVLVLALEHGLRGYAPTPDFALRIWLLVLGIGFLVSVVEYRSALRAIAPARPAPPAKALPAEATGTSPSVVPPDPQHWDLFFRALDPALGRSLISLTKQDHYLKVVTREGEALILKRMADAVAELDGYPGMQVHRSHWVAFEAVEAVERATGRWVVRLSDGRTLPVSRPNAAPLRAAIDPPRGHAM